MACVVYMHQNTSLSIDAVRDLVQSLDDNLISSVFPSAPTAGEVYVYDDRNGSISADCYRGIDGLLWTKSGILSYEEIYIMLL